METQLIKQLIKQPLTKTLGLDKMKSLMRRLGNPQEELKIIHVAGTNGKGSVCSMLNSILIEANYLVGLFTSPHLIDYNERIRVQNIPIDDKDFEKLNTRIEKICKEMVGDGEESPTFFEYITAMAFLYFAEKNVDIVVLETGIGGTYDVTNIIKTPLVSVITSIGKDHMAMLGDTIEQITQEKAGIIKENCHTVLYKSDRLVYNSVNGICKDKKSLLFSCQDVLISQEHYNMDGTRFTAKDSRFTYQVIYLQLLGKYQVSNAITTLMTIESLKLQGYEISKKVVYSGLKNTKWPGRMEIVQKSPTIILDGAHNEQSAKAVTTTLSTLTKKRKICMLIGVLKDKDYTRIVEILIPFADTIIVTEITNKRALSAERLYNTIKDKGHLDTQLILEKNIRNAYKIGQELLKENDILCCLGSLYLVGEIKQLLKKGEDKNVKV